MRLCFLFAVGVFFSLAGFSAENNLLPATGDEAWKDLENANKPPVPTWTGTPTTEQKEEFQKTLADKSGEAAAKAHEFYTRFPDHARAAEAKERERRFVQQALNFGASNLPKAVESTLSEDERISLKLNLVNRRAMAKQPQGMPAVIKEFETGLRGLLKEFPENASLWSQMLIVAQNSDDEEHANAVLDEIVASKVVDEDTKGRAKGLLRARGAIGRPLDISFTATDGSKIEIQKMNGKVVLLDFWASWCGPCMVSLPELIEMYGRYHEKGLEILGINMDKQRPAMDGAIQKLGIPWQQYFDGRGWGNRYAMEYNVTAIPAMFLVDKRGILRSINAREDLEKKVKELLAESDKL